MSVDFTALFDHRLTWAELYDLPARLNAAWFLPPPLQRFVAEFVRAGPTRWAWERDVTYSNVAEELFETRHLSLSGPDGFHGSVYRTGIEIAHLARWWSFLYEQDAQEDLRAASRLIARAVHATFAFDADPETREHLDKLVGESRSRPHDFVPDWRNGLESTRAILPR